jgi:hypothetical protein
MGTKVCSKCGEEKPFKDFAINSKGLHGYKSVCKVCSNSAQKLLYASRKEKATEEEWYLETRERQLKKKYGLSLDEFETMSKKQGALCKICRGPPDKGKPLYVDHCHATGNVRGLLCNNCNQLLGKARDNIEILEEAIKYLKEYG